MSDAPVPRDKPRAFVPREDLVREGALASLPPVDVARFRADIDGLLDQSVEPWTSGASDDVDASESGSIDL